MQSALVLSDMQLQYEARSLGVGSVDAQGTVHAGGHERADGQAQSVALGQVAYFAEGFEEVFAAVFRNAAACVGNDELLGMRTSLL